MVKAIRWNTDELAHYESHGYSPDNNATPRRSGYQTSKLEQQEQFWFIDWCETQHILHTDNHGQVIEICLADLVVAYPAGAYLQGHKKQRAMQWALLRNMGCKKGAADLVLYYVTKQYGALHIEMKRRRDQFRSGGEISRAVTAVQSDHLQLMRRIGHKTCIAFGWVEAARHVCEYLGWNASDRGLAADAGRNAT